MARVLLGGLLMLVVAMGVGRFAYTPILPAMQAATGLGGGGAGLLASLNFLGYFAGALGAGLLPRGAVRTAAFRASLVASVVTTVGMGLTRDFTLWAVLRFVSGVASAGVFVPGVAMVLDALARHGREGRAGWMYAGVGLGMAGSGLFVALFGGRLGWDGDWLALGALCAVLAVPAWMEVHDRAAPAAGGAAAVAGGRLPAPLALLTVAYFLQGVGYIITGTFLVAMLKAAPDTAAVGEAAWMVVGLAAAPAAWLWAVLGRRVGMWRALIVAHLVQVAAVLMPLAGAGPAVALVAAMLFGSTFLGIVTVVLMLGRTLSAGASARVIGALTSAYGLGQIVGPLPAGIAVARTGGFDAALIGAALVLMLAALFLALGAGLARRSATLAEEVPART